MTDIDFDDFSRSMTIQMGTKISTFVDQNALEKYSRTIYGHQLFITKMTVDITKLTIAVVGKVMISNSPRHFRIILVQLLEFSEKILFGDIAEAFARAPQFSLLNRRIKHYV